MCQSWQKECDVRDEEFETIASAHEVVLVLFYIPVTRPKYIDATDRLLRFNSQSFTQLMPPFLVLGLMNSRSVTCITIFLETVFTLIL